MSSILTHWSKRTILGALLAASFLFAGAAGAEPANLGLLKTALTAYHQKNYAHDLAAVDARAQAYVAAHLAGVKKPAIVLDIDETSLSNWPEIAADDFGYIHDGPCDALPKGPCGAKAWELSARAEAIGPTLALFKALRAKGVDVFFITGRDESERAATEQNLHQAGYDGWAKLIMRATGSSTPSAADYKAPERAKIEAAGYRIIANIGDQKSDLAGGHAMKGFKLSNPFYFIP
jgi:predicted secreted acid phosphatase